MEKFWAAIRALLPWSRQQSRAQAETPRTEAPGHKQPQREEETGSSKSQDVQDKDGEPDTVEDLQLPPPPANLRWLIAGATTQGRRSSNQDAYKILLSGDGVCRLCVVADGMGGESKGDLASQAAVEAMGNYYREHNPIPSDSEDWLRKAFHAAAQAVIDVLGPSSGGTTLTAICHDSTGTVGIAWVGDSPTIHVRGSSQAQLTKPHTVAQKLLDLGVKQSEFGANCSHVLLRHLGTTGDGLPAESHPDFRPFYVKAGDWLVISSDGLTNVLFLSEIGSVLAASANPEEAARKLMDLALSKNPGDNVTFILVQYLDDADSAATGAGPKAVPGTTGNAI